MTTDELRIILSVNGAQGYVNAMNQVTRATGGFDASAGKLMSTLSKLVSAAAIIKFSKQCIDAASDLQEVANVMNVTFGDSAVLVDQWAKTQAASFGLSETAAKRYIGTYGTMATQFGYTREQAAQMGIELTKLTGDVASFYNIEDKLAAVKLKSVFTGETETLKELGVVMTQANLDAYAMEKGLGKTTKQMSENEKVALRYSFVMDRLSHAQGDFARTSDGWANSVRLLKLNLENLKIEIGNQLLPVAGQGLAAINKGLQTLSPILVSVATTIKLYAQAWKNASETTKGVVKTAMAAFAVAIAAPKVITVVSKAIKVLTVDALTLGGALSFVAGLAGIILAGIAIADLAKQVKELRSTTENISNIGESADVSADAVGNLSDAMDELGDSAQGLDTFLASFDEVNKVGGSSSLMSNLVNTEDLANILGVADGLGDIKGMIGELNSSISDMSLPDISDNTFLDPKWWRKKWRAVKTAIIEYLKTFFDGSWKENWNIGLDMIGDWFEEHLPNWSKFWEGVGEFWADALQPVKKALDAVSDKFDAVWQKFEKSDWFKFWSGLGESAFDSHYEDITSRGGSHYRGSEQYTYDTPAPRSLTTYNSGASNKTVNQTNVTNNSGPTTVEVNPTILLDGRKITGVVIDGINAITRSAGKSPLVE